MGTNRSKAVVKLSKKLHAEERDFDGIEGIDIKLENGNTVKIDIMADGELVINSHDSLIVIPNFANDITLKSRK